MKNDKLHILIIPSWYPEFEGDYVGSFFREQALGISRQNCKVGIIYPELKSLRSLKFRFMSFIKYNRGLSIADGAAKRRREFPTIEDALISYTGRGAFTTWDKEWIKDYLEGGTLKTSSGVELSCSPEWEAATFRSSSMDTWRYLKQIKIDVMVVYGKFGSTFSAQARRVLFRLGHNWHSKYYEKASHFLPMEFSDSIVEDLQSYLKRI